MDSITSSAKPPDSKGVSPRLPWYLTGVKAGLEGGVVAAAGGWLAWRLVAPEHQARAWLGLALAWSACTAATLALAYGQGRSARWFWRTFGFGVALRASVLVALIAVVWRGPVAEAGALLVAYVLGLTAILLLESRHLVKDLGTR